MRNPQKCRLESKVWNTESPMVFAKQLAKVIGLLETLVFFDEIQECTRAITSLKYFCEKMRDLHVVCAGSLLGVALKLKRFRMKY